jgi:hypothetical protein
MRTEEEWAKFAQHVQVGNRIQYNYGDVVLEGVLLENYPHAEIEICKQDHSSHGPYDLLQVKFDDGHVGPILANYEYFWHDEDRCWYLFDDIMMFEDEPA